MSGAKEAEILASIREAETEYEQIVRKAHLEKDRIIETAHKGANELLLKKADETRNAKDKKVNDFRAKMDSIKKEKIEESKKEAARIEAKAEKRRDEAAEYIIKKLEEMI